MSYSNDTQMIIHIMDDVM